jgi:hypothetical protein
MALGETGCAKKFLSGRTAPLPITEERRSLKGARKRRVNTVLHEKILDETALICP